MNRTTIALAAALVLVAGLALADKTVTYLSANPKPISYQAWPDDAVPGGIVAEMCASPQLQGGGFGPVTCYRTKVGAASPVAIDTMAIINNRGLPFWKSQEGL